MKTTMLMFLIVLAAAYVAAALSGPDITALQKTTLQIVVTVSAAALVHFAVKALTNYLDGGNDV